MVENFSELQLFTDGGSRNNPGQAAIGLVVKKITGEVLHREGRVIGIKTNNEAEYLALLAGLRQVTEFSPEVLHCYLDSELIVNQLNGLYRVKNERLRDLYQEVRKLAQSFPKVIFVHIPREKNKEADSLVNEALDNEEL